MLRIVMSAFACCLPVVCALSAQAAEAVKIKPVGIVYQDAGNLPLKSPEGVACSKSAIFVSDTGNGRLVKYSLVNDELKSGTEIKVAQVSYPLRLKAVSQGGILALDGKTRKIARLAPDGAFVGYLEYRNIPAPAEVVPRSMTVDARDNVYVADVLGGRVLVVDSSGAFLRQIPFPKDYGVISDVEVDQKGAVYLLDGLNARIYKAGPDAASFMTLASGLQSYLYFAVTIDIDSQGRIYLLDQNDSGVVLLGTDGAFQGRYLSHGWKAGQLNYPSQACLTEAGDFIIADRNNSRIQLFKIQ